MQRSWLVATAGALAIAGAGCSSSSSVKTPPAPVLPSPSAALDPATALRLAKLACADVITIKTGIATDAKAETVLAEAANGKAAGEAAGDADPRWRSLASGMDLISTSLQNDDAAQASLGVAIVTDQCKLTAG